MLDRFDNVSPHTLYMYGEIILLSIAVRRFDLICFCLLSLFRFWLDFFSLLLRRCSFWILNSFQPFYLLPNSLSLSPTKWYTIKQFKFIWAWDQSFVCGWFFSSSFVCVCPGFYGWLRPFAPIVFTFLHHFSKCSGEMVHFLRHLIRTNHADSEPMARLPMLNMKWTL